MVARRNLSPRFEPDMPRQQAMSSLPRHGGERIVNINSRHAPNRQDAANGAAVYSEAVARSVKIKQAKYCRDKATEAVVVIAVNVALSIAAIAAIARLLPYQASQSNRLNEITTEVQTVEQRVNGMREKLPQVINSGRSQELLLRQQGWIKPNQITIKLLEPSEIATPNQDGGLPTTTTAQRSKQN
ncbi:MAG: hypothetical protein NW214_14155 [Pseudanabaenaceae cyanobacterium bins.39]|nr:hypothetical protein [Pseudanabaenaceae cyanobacterium bins.39]